MRRSAAPSGATRPPILATPPRACAQRDCTRPVGSPSSGRSHRPHALSRPHTLLMLFLYARHSNCGRRRRRTGGVGRPSLLGPSRALVNRVHKCQSWDEGRRQCTCRAFGIVLGLISSSSTAFQGYSSSCFFLGDACSQSALVDISIVGKWESRRICARIGHGNVSRFWGPFVRRWR